MFLYNSSNFRKLPFEQRTYNARYQIIVITSLILFMCLFSLLCLKVNIRKQYILFIIITLLLLLLSGFIIFLLVCFSLNNCHWKFANI